MSDAPDVAEVLEDRPDLRSALEAALAAEEAADGEPWTFEDIAADSGTFGELVSRGLVESSGDGYRLVDPPAVRRTLGGEEGSTATGASTASIEVPSVGLPAVDRRVTLAIAGVLALVAAVRLFAWPSVFRGEHVVLSGNDPYFYRALVEGSVGSPDLLVDGAMHGEPLLVAALAVTSGLLGGLPAVGVVMAWYPVVAALLGTLLLYLLAVRVTRDRRVALAAVALLAVTPAHVLRTSLGFADHHALDYLLLGITATAFVWLVTRTDDDPAWTVVLAAVGLGVGTGGQVLAWNAGPLVLGAVALAVLLQTLVDVRAGRSPLYRQGPVLAGLALGGIIAGVGFLGPGWQSALIASSAVLLFVGAVAVTITGELADRRGWSSQSLALATVGIGLAAVIGGSVVQPELLEMFLTGLARITETGSQTAEMQPLVSAATIGSLSQLGFLLAVALPALVWVSAHLFRGSPGADRWVVPTAGGWYFLGLSLFQVRFVGEFAPFVALFSGLAFVWLAAAVDLTTAPGLFEERVTWRPSLPSARTAGAVFALFLLVGGLAAVQAPIKISQVTVDQGTYATAIRMVEFADERGWTGADERYVFSQWGRNRVYNYFVNGDSRSYSYAFRRFDNFAQNTRESSGYSNIANRVAFVVTSDVFSTDPDMLHHRLHRNLGSATGADDGLGHFRLVYVAEGRSHVAFTPVPGAILAGNGPANASVSAETVVDAGTRDVTYRRRGSTNATGAFRLRVANPGTYKVTVGGTSTTVEVSESAVHEGETVRAEG